MDMSQILELPKKMKVITEILDEPILQNQLVKPSEILRLIAMERRYKWVTGIIDTGDGVHRCALGAIYGYLGWKGFGNGRDYLSIGTDYSGWKSLNECINKTADMFGGDRSEISKLAAYNNEGHDYNQCAEWLEAKGF